MFFMVSHFHGAKVNVTAINRHSHRGLWFIALPYFQHKLSRLMRQWHIHIYFCSRTERHFVRPLIHEDDRSMVKIHDVKMDDGLSIVLLELSFYFELLRFRFCL